ncbi:myosin heavy chain IB-like [Onychomys torridus]|uniref:myosin heavy chain IB-like n=1 Tax=Onychomys torridus TaxID=38674 RepID=UPI00167F52B0|nr:myosin heavy chain IB-like [Onychomys torridus]
MRAAAPGLRRAGAWSGGGGGTRLSGGRHVARHVAVRLRARARVEGCGHAPSEGRSALSGGERAQGEGRARSAPAWGAGGEGWEGGECAARASGRRSGAEPSWRGAHLAGRARGRRDPAVGPQLGRARVPAVMLVGGGPGWRGRPRRSLSSPAAGLQGAFPGLPAPTRDGPGVAGSREADPPPGPWAETGHACAPTGGPGSTRRDARFRYPAGGFWWERSGAERGTRWGSVVAEMQKKKGGCVRSTRSERRSQRLFLRTWRRGGETKKQCARKRAF